MTAKRVFTVVAAAAVTISVSACGSMETADQIAGKSTGGASSSSCPVKINSNVTGTIRIAWQSIPNADLIVKDQKLLEKCMPKATIKWSQFNSGGDVVQAFGSKSLDIGLAGSSPSVKAVSAPLSLPVKVIWIHDVIGKAESLVTRDSDITTIEGLKGKTIATPFGSTSHFSLLMALQKAGMSSSDVSLINLDPDKMEGAWTKGQIDAAWVWDPVLSELKKDGGTVVTSSAVTAKEGAATYDMELASDNFISKNPSALVTWTAVENYAVGLIKSKPTQAAESIAAQLGITTSQVKSQFAGYTYPKASEQKDIFTDELPSVFKKTAEFLKDQGSLDSVNSNYANNLYATAIKAVAK